MNPWNPSQPFNQLPTLPPQIELETKAVLKQCILARAALAELRQAGELIPNQSVLINILPLLEAKDSSEIENIVTTADRLFQHAGGAEAQADPATNALIITAPEPQYRQMRVVIDQLDARRAQVFVESLIVEINSDKAAEFGMQLQGAFGRSGDALMGSLGSNFGKGGNNAPGATTPATNLPKNVAEAPGTAGPHGGSRPSAESHSGNAR